jgi:DNA-binding transcriptional LysR family regulator
LRIVAPHSTFLPVLWPVLDSFMRLHPDVQPDVQLEDRIGNWVEDRVDVGFRIGPSPAEGVIARRLFPLQLIICASPEYLARHGAPASLESLASHRCSVFRHSVKGKVLPWHVKVGDETITQEIVPALCANDEGLETEAVLAGHVIGSLTGIAAAPHLRAGRLVPLLTKHVAERSSVFLYYGSRAAQPVRTRTFIDHVLASLLDSDRYVLSVKELLAAESRGRRALRR